MLFPMILIIMNISDNNTASEVGADSSISPVNIMKTSDCKDSAKSKLEVNLMHNNTSSSTTTNDDSALSVCANCGKEGSEVNNICNKCKQVTYCNAACKKKHRSKHKKACERRVAELHDEKLFKEPPSQQGDCPICFLRIPIFGTGCQYYSCCGMTVCSGCIHAPVYDNQGNKVDIKTCPFCRTPYLNHMRKQQKEREKE